MSLTENQEETEMRRRIFGRVVSACGSSSVGTAAHLCSMLLETNNRLVSRLQICVI
jgi:hypothetical protein